MWKFNPLIDREQNKKKVMLLNPEENISTNTFLERLFHPEYECGSKKLVAIRRKKMEEQFPIFEWKHITWFKKLYEVQLKEATRKGPSAKKLLSNQPPWTPTYTRWKIGYSGSKIFEGDMVQR